MEDYPRTLRELEARFSTEQACRDYLSHLRWPQGFRCPACDATEAWLTGRGLRMCAGYGHQTSVTAGTIFQDTRTLREVYSRKPSLRQCMEKAGLQATPAGNTTP